MVLKNIPEELQSLNQWVGVGVDSKVPMRVDTLGWASSTNPNTWCSFEDAQYALKLGEITHSGFVFNDNGIVGIDIDDGYADDGLLSSLAIDIITHCKSYTERSRSGRGFHILVKGDIPFKGKNNRNGVEIYKTARYFIMTGDTLLYRNLEENQEALDYIVDKYFPEMRETTNNKSFAPRIYTPKWDKPSERIRLRPIYEKINDGCRNISLTSLAGQWHNLGYNPKHIYQELLYVNKVACSPPLDVSEIESIVRSVTRYRRYNND